MKFVVDYRGPDGSRQQKEIEASDRAAVFSELKKLGISAITVREGALSKKASSASPSLVKGIIAGLVVVIALAGVLYLVLGNRDEKPKEKKVDKTKLIEEVTPVVKTPKKGSGVVDLTKTETKSDGPKVLGKTPTGEDYVAMTASTNAEGVVEERYQLPNGKWKSVIQLQRKETAVFDNEFDLVLASIAMIPLDQPLPPMPNMGNLDEAFRKAIQSPIIIRETDSDRAKAMKEGALNLRKEIAELMDEGYTVDQIMAEHNSLRQKNIEFRGEFQKELNELYRQGKIDEAQNYCEKMNEALQEKGILPLIMPGTGKSKHERRAE